jgi:hypothetical protein
MELDQSSAITVGAVLLAVIAVAYGGTFLLNVVTGRAETNDLQKSFFRAGHAHAGVLITLGLLVVVVTSTAGVPGWAHEFSSGVLYAAILMPAGFFLSVVGKDPQRPNRLIILLWLGVASLTVGLLAAGIGLIMAGTA